MDPMMQELDEIVNSYVLTRRVSPLILPKTRKGQYSRVGVHPFRYSLNAIEVHGDRLILHFIFNVEFTIDVTVRHRR